jgi:dTMP kinase
MYIVIEGIDTAGKSTQLKILQKKYKNAIFTKEPGATKIGKKLRQMVLNGKASSNIAEMFLFLADRAEHIHKVIKPNKDKMIISDRSLVSGIAYALNLDITTATSLNLIAVENTLPTHIILLELNSQELTKRLQGKQNDSIESRGVEYLLNIQDRIKQSIKTLKLNHIFIDASLPIDTISYKINKFLKM